MKFSIVIPLYNKQRYIRQAIESVLAQTLQDFELLVVNDASTDGSRELAQSYGRVKLIDHGRNKGLSASRNTGIQNSQAPFIVFLDADDYWEPGFLAEISILTEVFSQASLFATAYDEVYPSHVLNPRTLLGDVPNGARLLITDYFARNLGQPLYNHSSLCVRKSLFEQIGGYDQELTFSEDVEFGIRANLASPLAYSNCVLSHYRAWAENQITNNGIKDKKIPDLGYLELEKDREDLKKYLDFERYVLAMHCKLCGRTEFEKLASLIDPASLNFKQRFLLASPAFVVRLIRTFKRTLLRIGLRWSTY